MAVTAERLGKLQSGVDLAKQAYEDALAARDQALWEADAEGRTLGWMARATGKKTSHLQRIVIRETKRRQR